MFDMSLCGMVNAKVWTSLNSQSVGTRSMCTTGEIQASQTWVYVPEQRIHKLKGNQFCEYLVVQLYLGSILDFLIEVD